MKLDLTYCHRCKSSHDFGKHTVSMVLTPDAAPEQISLRAGICATPVETPLHGFDKTAYQREYMRDKRAAEKIGLTVKAYRAQMHVEKV